MTLSLEVPLKVVLEPMPSSSREKPPSSLGDIKSKRTAGSWIDAPAFAVLSRSESLWGGSRILLNPGRLFSNLSLSNSRFSSFLSCKSCLSRLRSVVTWERWKYRSYSFTVLQFYDPAFNLREKENTFTEVKVGSITSRCSGKEPATRHERAAEIEPKANVARMFWRDKIRHSLTKKQTKYRRLYQQLTTFEITLFPKHPPLPAKDK